MKTLRHMPPERLSELIARFPKSRIAVVGDFFLDKYLDVARRERSSAIWRRYVRAACTP